MKDNNFILFNTSNLHCNVPSQLVPVFGEEVHQLAKFACEKLMAPPQIQTGDHLEVNADEEPSINPRGKLLVERREECRRVGWSS